MTTKSWQICYGLSRLATSWMWSSRSWRLQNFPLGYNGTRRLASSHSRGMSFSKEPVSRGRTTWHLIPQVQTAVETIFDELHSLGLKPNMNKGKTEVVLSIRGPKRTPVAQHLHGPCNSHIVLPNQPQDFSNLRVVPHYIHLGGMISHSGKLRCEIRRRLGIAQQSFRDLAPKVFSNAKVSLDTRLAIFNSTVWMALIYGVGTWGRLTPVESRLWHAGVFRLYKGLLRRIVPPATLLKFSDDQVLSKVRLPHPEDIIRLCRLRHFGQTLGRAPDYFWALLAEEGQWLQTLKDDFVWLYSNIDGLTSMPCPGEQPHEWHDLILNKPGRWRGLVKRVACHSTLQRVVQADQRIFHKNFLELLYAAGLRCYTPTTI